MDFSTGTLCFGFVCSLAVFLVMLILEKLGGKGKIAP